MFLFSGLAQYGGAALAVALFAVIPSPTVAWLRIAVAAVVLLAWRRPWGGPGAPPTCSPPWPSASCSPG
jgi:threonine/homoserine efflux transporter RhtA